MPNYYIIITDVTNAQGRKDSPQIVPLDTIEEVTDSMQKLLRKGVDSTNMHVAKVIQDASYEMKIEIEIPSEGVVINNPVGPR